MNPMMTLAILLECCIEDMFSLLSLRTYEVLDVYVWLVYLPITDAQRPKEKANITCLHLQTFNVSAEAGWKVMKLVLQQE